MAFLELVDHSARNTDFSCRQNLKMAPKKTFPSKTAPGPLRGSWYLLRKFLKRLRKPLRGSGRKSSKSPVLRALPTLPSWARSEASIFFPTQNFKTSFRTIVRRYYEIIIILTLSYFCYYISYINFKKDFWTQKWQTSESNITPHSAMKSLFFLGHLRLMSYLHIT